MATSYATKPPGFPRASSWGYFRATSSAYDSARAVHRLGPSALPHDRLTGWSGIGSGMSRLGEVPSSSRCAAHLPWSTPVATDGNAHAQHGSWRAAWGPAHMLDVARDARAHFRPHNPGSPICAVRVWSRWAREGRAEGHLLEGLTPAGHGGVRNRPERKSCHDVRAPATHDCSPKSVSRCCEHKTEGACTATDARTGSSSTTITRPVASVDWRATGATSGSAGSGMILKRCAVPLMLWRAARHRSRTIKMSGLR